MSDALCTRLQQQVVLSGTAPSSESLDLDCVIDDILSRLPAKSLLRFRCVCKAWRALISDPYFIRKHLSCIDTKISTSYSLLIKEQIFRSAEYEAILKCLSHDGPLPSRRLDFLDLLTREIVGRGYLRGRLFHLDQTYVGEKPGAQSRAALTLSSDKLSEIWLWNRRLGHSSFSLMRKTMPTLFIGVDESVLHCETCVLAKSHRATYSPSVSNKSAIHF
ncbi:putative F-box protein At3g52320 isoform X2 [Rosa rugosa]|uniref:putative F-box protein At3g52320 isoform X2 n=1 Tax=Rosa rugosa TaxID=74645 RepID=UPI002B41428E|nr:putative F-box protein At3g52320 isoform X2 [Rosa rugosa]